MTSRTHIIYLPGLGDRYDPMRRFFLRAWSLYGAHVTMIPMRWASNEPYNAKRARVLSALDMLDNERIVLMGESAGGSMAVSVFAAQSGTVVGTMTLCGKNTRSDNVSHRIYAHNPAFRESMQQAEALVRNLQPKQSERFVSIVPLYDPTVPVAETLIPGCQKITLPLVGHLAAILAMLTIFAPLVVHRAKNFSR
ncbi:MAG: hypothetical protein UY35_C0022G0008 [Candidatus Saccharibacteria bacterium GW2011_GWC2_48_9]|nr:MAG: hypothetical protein UY35_C0022G0008 [Candidatus Saccharibacteria bacterium GW2011_GWC2_48_9]HCH34714.1 hypothetical protein [Candidatus Saccharibacteria bacterium]